IAMRTVLLQVPPAFTCTGTEHPMGASEGTVKLIWSMAALPGARPLYATLACLPPTHTCTVNGRFPPGGGWLSGVVMGPSPVPHMTSTWPGLAGMESMLRG